MGQMAEDILDGSCCDLCGCYFQHPTGGIYVHDEPVTCFDCWEDLTDEEKTIHKKADVKTFY
jgi:hypothetical protein